MAQKISTKQAYSEVVAFLNMLDAEFINKLPPKLIDVFKNNMDSSYTPIYDKNIPIKEQNLSRQAIVILSKLNLQYWANETEKDLLMVFYEDNDNKN